MEQPRNRPARVTGESKRDDWAYKIALDIYALTMLDGRPTLVVDSIAEHLRAAVSEANCLRMLRDMQRDLGIGEFGP